MALRDDMAKVGAVTLGIFDSEGTEVFGVMTGVRKTEESQFYTVPAGKIEQKSHVNFSYEISAATLMKAAYVIVVDTRGGGRAEFNIPLFPGNSSQEGSWDSIGAHHEIVLDKRQFTIYATNWSHDMDRAVQLHLEFETANLAIEYAWVNDSKAS